MERFPTFLFSPLQNDVIRSYLNVELTILKECIGHLSPAGGLFQSHIPYGCRVSQAIKENLVEQKMIVSIRFHLHTKHAHGTRISSAIILDKLRCLKLGRLNEHREIGQTI